MPFRLTGLGELSLHDAERRRISVPRKALAAMAVLAAAGPRSVRRDRLVALLWPEAGDAGRGALKQTIYELRQALGNANVITGTGELSLDPAWVSCDFAELEAAHTGGDWQRVIDLYAGPFLDGFHVRDSAEFDHWIDGRRAHYESLLHDALERVAEAAIQRDDHAAALPLWRRLAAQDPLSGRVALNLMKALASAGDAAGALTHYQVYQRLLQDQLGVPPEPEVTAEAERIRARLGAAEVQPARLARSDGGDAAVHLPAIPTTASDQELPAVIPSRESAREGRWQMRDVQFNRRLWIGVAAALSVVALTVATVRVAGARARVIASVSLPRHADMRVVVDQHVNRVYVDGGASFDAALSLLDGEMRATRTLPAGAGVVIDPVTHWYWSGDYRAREVVVRNGRTDAELGRVAVPGCPHAFALAGEWVWVAQQCNDHISVIDSRRRQVVRHIAIPTLSRTEVGGAKGMGEIVVNRNTGVAYFTRDGLPHRVDPRSWELRETIGFDGPVMAVNEATNLLYVKVDGGLRVLDGATEKLVAEIALPSTPGRAAVGFGGHRVYATTNEGLIAVDGKTHRVLYVRTLGEGFVPDGVALDVVRNRAYVIGNDAGGSRSLKVVSLAD